MIPTTLVTPTQGLTPVAVLPLGGASIAHGLSETSSCAKSDPNNPGHPPLSSQGLITVEMLPLGGASIASARGGTQLFFGWVCATRVSKSRV